jgi:nucleoside-diphosphate-sugar epimerase
LTIVVIGRTGLIGSKLVTKLGEQAHEAVPASPDTGVNTLTGEGVSEAVDGARGAAGFWTRVADRMCDEWPTRLLS